MDVTSSTLYIICIFYDVCCIFVAHKVLHFFCIQVQLLCLLLTIDVHIITTDQLQREGLSKQIHVPSSLKFISTFQMVSMLSH